MALTTQDPPPDIPTDLKPATPTLMGIPVECRLQILGYLVGGKAHVAARPLDLHNKLVQLNVPDNDPSDSISIQNGTSGGKTRSTNEVIVPQGRYQPRKSYQRTGFSPQILSVCRQMYDEGRELLYANKEVCVTYYADESNGRDLGSYVVGEHSLEAALSRYPSLREVSSWRICFYPYPTCRLAPTLPVWYDRLSQMTARDAKALSQLGTLKTLTFEFHTLSFDGQPQHPVFPMLVSPYRGVRAETCKVLNFSVNEGEHKSISRSWPITKAFHYEVTSGLSVVDVPAMIEETRNIIAELDSATRSGPRRRHKRNQFVGLPDALPELSNFVDCKLIISNLETRYAEHCLDTTRLSILQAIADCSPYFEHARQAVLAAQKQLVFSDSSSHLNRQSAATEAKLRVQLDKIEDFEERLRQLDEKYHIRALYHIPEASGETN